MNPLMRFASLPDRLHTLLPHYLFLPLVIVGLFFFTSCDNNSGGNTGLSGDSLASNSNTNDENGSGHAPAVDNPNGSTNNPDQNAVQTVSTGPKNFTELVELFTVDLIADEYKKVKMDPLDQLPKFNEANESIFLRYQMRKPTQVDRGMKTYPRFILKSYRFATEDAADRAVTGWLNDFESSADSIALGQEVEAVKSPPLFCALREDGFFILQTACVYQHTSLDNLKERFFTWMEDTGGRMGWEISCEAGKLTYRFQHDL